MHHSLFIAAISWPIKQRNSESRAVAYFLHELYLCSLDFYQHFFSIFLQRSFLQPLGIEQSILCLLGMKKKGNFFVRLWSWKLYVFKVCELLNYCMSLRAVSLKPEIYQVQKVFCSLLVTLRFSKKILVWKLNSPKGLKFCNKFEAEPQAFSNRHGFLKNYFCTTSRLSLNAKDHDLYV